MEEGDLQSNFFLRWDHSPTDGYIARMPALDWRTVKTAQYINPPGLKGVKSATSHDHALRKRV